MAQATSMVTARMDTKKKHAGARVLSKLGTSPSQAINDLYDYLIDHESLPREMDGKMLDDIPVDQEEQLARAVALVDAIPSVRLDDRYAHMSERDAHRERLGLNNQPYNDARVRS